MRIFRKRQEKINALWQIYGEVNRIRLILSESSETGKRILKFDEENNFYVPYNESSAGRKQYKKMNEEKG